MAEYIEREVLLELYVDGKYDTADYRVPVPVIIQNIKDIPAADVVPVVRCKDCEYWDRETIRQNSNDAGWWNEAICKEHTTYGNEHRDAWTSAEWYCADGIRMDGDA